MDDALRAPGRLPWKSLTTFPPRSPSPTSSTELEPIFIEYENSKTSPEPGHQELTGKAPLIEPDSLSKQTGPPLMGTARGAPAAEKAIGTVRPKGV